MLDERLITALHVEALRREQVHAEHEPHRLFQASTIGSLLDGAYEGDLTFAELAEHGDLGLGTLNGLDGEMIALDGGFYRADVDGAIREIHGEARTPFAAVVFFEPTIDVAVGAGPVLEAIDAVRPADCAAFAVRIDGQFELVRARSVPRQAPPYRPLVEVAAEQHVFELTDLGGTLVGFSFPDYAEGLELTGYHLHFISDDRRRGGHVLDCRVRSGRLRIDPSSEWELELPPGVELDAGHVDNEALDRIEREHGRPALEVARAAFDAYFRGDEPVMFELLDPDIVVTQFPEQPDVRSYRGHAGVREVMADWIGTWDDYSIELLELREIGNCVVASLRQRGRGKGSGVAMEGDTWFVWHVRGGRLVRWQMFSSEREALEAAAEPYPRDN